MRNHLSRLTPLLVLAAAPAASGWAAPVPKALQQPVIDHFRGVFVLPDLVIWQFDQAKPYPLGGMTVCGHVNILNSTRRYMGLQPFYAVVRDGAWVEGDIVGNKVQDPTGAVAASYKTLCGPS